MTAAATNDVHRRLDLIVRRERGRLVADLVAYLGGAELSLAEDVAQDALLAALRTWPYRGLPDNPSAWLARTARNKAIDVLRRRRKQTPYAAERDRREAAAGDLFTARIEDPELRLIILCCNEHLSEMDRLALTLKAVSGFTAREIAAVFLVKESAMAQRIARAKRKLRALHDTAEHGVDEPPVRLEINDRLPTLLKVTYLMFSVGYAPRSGPDLTRKDVAFEALRIACELARNKATTHPEAQALAALLCLQASRMDARLGRDGNLVLLRDQDRNTWNRSLIDSGLSFLKASQTATQVSRYHLEAGIAAMHATAPSWQDCNWPGIVTLYNQLLQTVDSPVVTINACVARAMTGDAERALSDLDALSNEAALADYAPYYVARAEVLCQLDRDADAMSDFRRAIECGSSTPVLRHLEQRLASCV